MLVLVLLLVVAALGLLIAALTTANTLWAWISVLISVVAAGLLVVDWVRNRRRRSQAAPATDRTSTARGVPVTDPAGRAAAAPVDIVDRGPDRPDVAADPEATSVDAQAPVRQPLGPQISRLDLPTISDAELDEVFNTPSAPEPVRLDPNVEPAEEATDATDLLVVSELADEVVVIDERPRYHLRACTWLGDRQTMPLPVSEARELGFTPCGHCRPDATLAASHRARR